MATAIELFKSPDLTPLEFLLVALDGERRVGKKVDARDVLLARILDAAACIKKHEDQLKHHAILAHVLTSVLKLMMGFFNIYCEL